MNNYKAILKSKNAWLATLICILVACGGGKGRAVKPSNTKIDTALVLRALQGAPGRFPAEFLCVKKDGNLIDIKQNDKYRFSSAGDTVIIVHDRENAVIVRNMTMENKIKAFTRQK